MGKKRRGSRKRSRRTSSPVSVAPRRRCSGGGRKRRSGGGRRRSKGILSSGVVKGVVAGAAGVLLLEIAKPHLPASVAALGPGVGLAAGAIFDRRHAMAYIVPAVALTVGTKVAQTPTVQRIASQVSGLIPGGRSVPMLTGGGGSGGSSITPDTQAILDSVLSGARSA